MHKSKKKILKFFHLKNSFLRKFLWWGNKEKMMREYHHNKTSQGMWVIFTKRFLRTFFKTSTRISSTIAALTISVWLILNTSKWVFATSRICTYERSSKDLLAEEFSTEMIWWVMNFLDLFYELFLSPFTFTAAAVMEKSYLLLSKLFWACQP